MSRPTNPNKVDLDEAREVTLTLLSALQTLNGKPLPAGRDRVGVLAPTQRELLYLSHLCDVIKVEIMQTYHDLRN
jgi:hypothetical protein